MKQYFFSSLFMIAIFMLVLPSHLVRSEESFILSSGKIAFLVNDPQEREARVRSNTDTDFVQVVGARPQAPLLLPWPYRVQVDFTFSDPRNKGLDVRCASSLESEYVPSLKVHTLDKWIYDERTHGSRYGSYALQVDVINLEEAVRVAHSRGVWSDVIHYNENSLHEMYDHISPRDLCTLTGKSMLDSMIAPLVSKLHSRFKSTQMLSVSQDGLRMKMLCKAHGQNTFNICTAAKLHEILTISV